MGRHKKPQTILQELAKEAVAERKTAPRGRRQIKLRPVKLFEVLITHEDYTFESRLFNEDGQEFVAKSTLKGGDK